MKHRSANQLVRERATRRSTTRRLSRRACERPERGQGGGGAGDPRAAALPLGVTERVPDKPGEEGKSSRSIEALETEARRFRAENPSCWSNVKR